MSRLEHLQALVLGMALSSIAACTRLDDTPSTLVVEPLVIAVVSEPAEVFPGEAVQFKATVALPSGFEGTSTIDAWNYCTLARSPGSPSSVSEYCREEPGVALANRALEVKGTMPLDACRRFGPDPAMDDFRGQDPDVTGGYYQPVRLHAFESLWFHFQRVRCPAANLPTDAARVWAQRYIANKNPLITAFDVNGVKLPVPDSADVLSLDWERLDDMPDPIRVIVSWPKDSAESFAWFNVQTREVQSKREFLKVSWFTDVGHLMATGDTFFEQDSNATLAQAEWHVTRDVGNANLWVVVRDSRGGSTVVRLSLVEH